MCRWSRRFASENRERAFAPREVLAGRDARTLARDILQLTREELSRTYKGSPMERAKLRGLQRNAAVVLGNVGSSGEVPALAAALSSSEPLVRAHAAWALGRLRSPGGAEALRARLREEPGDAVREELRSASADLGGGQPPTSKCTGVLGAVRSVTSAVFRLALFVPGVGSTTTRAPSTRQSSRIFRSSADERCRPETKPE